MRLKIQPRASSKAFSIVELMVAMTIFVLLCTLLFSIVSGATSLWREQEARQEGSREARAALSVFSRDLQNAIITTNANWFHSDGGKLAFMTALPSSAQATNLDRGDICIVGYRLEWGRVNPADPSEREGLALYRYVRFSDPTYAENIKPQPVVSVQEVFDTVDGSNTIKELLARNVTRMSCDLYATNGAGLPVAYAASANPPDILEFSISTINDRTALKLASQSDWTNAQSLPVKQNEQTYGMRQHLRKP